MICAESDDVRGGCEVKSESDVSVSGYSMVMLLCRQVGVCACVRM
jgi:hypothetical protein